MDNLEVDAAGEQWHTRAAPTLPPADQIQRLDPRQRADKDPLDPANDFLAAGPSLRILQLNVEGLSDAQRTIHHQLSIALS